MSIDYTVRNKLEEHSKGCGSGDGVDINALLKKSFDTTIREVYNDHISQDAMNQLKETVLHEFEEVTEDNFAETLTFKAIIHLILMFGGDIFKLYSKVKSNDSSLYTLADRLEENKGYSLDAKRTADSAMEKVNGLDSRINAIESKLNSN